jgi:ABC-type multidrug transport system ATPase subunit
LLQRVNLTHVATRRVDSFSGGMRQRLGIAIALVASPRLLIVDEPTAGLDPAERYRLLDLLAGVTDDVVVLLSTHLVDDVEALCTRVALLVHGRIVREDTPAALVASLRGQLWQACVPRAQADAWRAHPRVISRRLAAGGVLVRAVHDAAPDSQFAPIDPTLEDVYFDELARQGVRSDQ